MDERSASISGGLVFHFFFFNDTATTEIYTLSLHDALPISVLHLHGADPRALRHGGGPPRHDRPALRHPARRACLRGDLRRRRSEEHTSELQSRQYLVCRLLLEKKKNVTVHSPMLCSTLLSF